MNDLVVADRAAGWRRLKALVLDRVSSPITKRVYNLGLDEFFAWYAHEPRAGFTKATVSAWRVALESRRLGSVSINVRITAVRKLAVEAADNGLLAPELAAGIARIKGMRSRGVRAGNWLSLQEAQALLSAPDATTKKGLRDRAILVLLRGCGLRRSEVAALTFRHVQQRDSRWCICGLGWETGPDSHARYANLGRPIPASPSNGRATIVSRDQLSSTPIATPAASPPFSATPHKNSLTRADLEISNIFG